nr:hypothetical protein [Paraburkholderia sp. BL8N3]
MEDDFIVAQATCGLLEQAGTAAADPIGSVHEALKFIEVNEHSFDGAVLDVYLHGEKSYAIADALVRLNVTFVLGQVTAQGYSIHVIETILTVKSRSTPARFFRCWRPLRSEPLVGRQR